ncbi:MAG: hypothetical protein ACKVXR_08160 [Planctomycetota bacterium]
MIPAFLPLTEPTTGGATPLLWGGFLFFLLGGLEDKFRYLDVGLAGVLVFVGAKMTLVDVYKMHPGVSLVVVLAILAGSVVASLANPAPAGKPGVPRN